MMVSPPQDLTLELQRVFRAVPAVVFTAFTDADEMAKWWGPKGFTIPSLDFEPRLGHSYRIKMQPPDGDAFSLIGEFRELDAPARLAYTFAWEPPAADDVETMVELSFQDLGAATQVGLTQRPFTTEARRTLHHHGWTDSFDKLERLLAAQQ